MKILYFLTGILMVAGVVSCADDNGNYDYATLNTITIKGMADEYIVDQNDTLWVDTLRLDFALEENAEVAYEWVIRAQSGEAEVISTAKNCGGRITQAPGSYTMSYLCVTDLTSDLKYYYPFRLTVNTPYQIGLYVLSETADGTAKLSMQRRDKENAPMMDNLFELCNPDLGILGKKPVQLSYYDWMKVSSSGLVVLCQEGDRKISLLNEETLLLEQYWNESSIENYSGSFEPVFYNDDMGGTVLDREGRVFTFNYSDNKTLYAPAEIENTRFSWIGGGSLASTQNYAYDEVSQQFVMLKNTDNPLKFDRMSPIDSLDTEGQTYRAFAVNGDRTLFPVLYDPSTGMEHYYELETIEEHDEYWTQYWYVYNHKEKAVRSAVMEEDSKCLLSDMDYWYVSKGNRVVRYFFSATSNVEEWTPGLEGRVTALMFDYEQDRIFVAAYDGTKSYIHEFSAANAKEELAEPMEVEGKIVSMCMAGLGDWIY
ncbi:MAG: PKD-like family lipoprotein [Odoribacter splanchnicus]|jgi:lipoprotein